MSNLPNEVVVDDPAKPWKAIMPMIVAVAYAVIEGIQVAWSDNIWDKNDTFTVVLLALSSILVYAKENPKTTRAV